MKTYTVPATSRFNVDVATVVPELQNESFGAQIDVTNGVDIAVERSLYWNANGVFWAGGTNALADAAAVICRGRELNHLPVPLSVPRRKTKDVRVGFLGCQNEMQFVGNSERKWRLDSGSNVALRWPDTAGPETPLTLPKDG